jgi:DNA repair protein RadB
MKFPIGCRPLDELLGGGIEQGRIYELFGEEGSGKTNFCLQAIRAFPQNNKKIGWIYTENFPSERLKQMCGDRNDCLDRLIIFGSETFDEQAGVVKRLFAVNRIGMLVIDSFNSLYRIELGKKHGKVEREFYNQLERLELLAAKKNIPIILTCQVYEDENGVQPFGGRSIENFAEIILKFEKLEGKMRRATLVKSPERNPKLNCTFRIIKEGLE